jgi:hypothetical protein
MENPHGFAQGRFVARVAESHRGLIPAILAGKRLYGLLQITIELKPVRATAITARRAGRPGTQQPHSQLSGQPRVTAIADLSGETGLTDRRVKVAFQPAGLGPGQPGRDDPLRLAVPVRRRSGLVQILPVAWLSAPGADEAERPERAGPVQPGHAGAPQHL